MLGKSCVSLMMLLLVTAYLFAQSREYRVDKAGDGGELTLHLPSNPGAMTVSPDGQQLAIAASSSLLLIDFSSGALLKTLVFQRGQIRGIAFAGDNNHIALAGVGGVAIYHIASGEIKIQIPGHPNTRRPQQTRTHDVVYVPESQQLMTISADESMLRSWSAEDGSAGQTLDLQIQRPQRLVISPDGSALAVSGSGNVMMYRLPDLQELWRLEEFGVNPVLAFSQDSRVLAVGDDGGGADATVLRVADGSEIASRYVGSGRVGGLAWLADGRLITAPSRFGFGIYVYPMKTEKESPLTLDKKFLATEDVDNAVVTGKSDSLVAVAGKKNLIKVYKLANND